MAAFGIVKNSEKTADFLGGRETVEKFFRANVIALAIVTVTLAVFVLAFLKSWKGMKSSIYQLLMTVCSAVLILYSGFSFVRSLVNIKEDLDGAESVSAEEFVLCKGSEGECFIGFDHGGESILLQIPHEEYEEHCHAAPSEDYSDSQVYDLIVNSQYGGYENAVFYRSKADIRYYANSVIYEDCQLEEIN